jgi:hypothetical protein
MCTNTALRYFGKRRQCTMAVLSLWSVELTWPICGLYSACAAMISDVQLQQYTVVIQVL